MKIVVNKLNAVFLMAILPLMSYADDAEDVVNRGIGLAEAIGALLYIAAFVLGVLFLINGISALKKYSENPQQAQQQGGLGKPIITTIAGAALTGFTVWNGIIQRTLLGEDDSEIERFNSD